MQFNQQLCDIIVRARNNGNNRNSISRAASSVNNEDELCVDMINKIVQASNNSKSKAAASAIRINKARVIADFIKSNGKRF